MPGNYINGVTFDRDTLNLTPNPHSDPGTGVGHGTYNWVTRVGDSVKGSSGQDVADLSSLKVDADQVISLGDGDDLFKFGHGKEGVNDWGREINGIVKMGDGGDDIVVFDGTISDYIFKIRPDGGIKVTYINDDGSNGASVTFYGADHFNFRNIEGNQDYINSVYNHDDLYNMIKAEGHYA